MASKEQNRIRRSEDQYTSTPRTRNIPVAVVESRASLTGPVNYHICAVCVQLHQRQPTTETTHRLSSAIFCSSPSHSTIPHSLKTLPSHTQSRGGAHARGTFGNKRIPEDAAAPITWRCRTSRSEHGKDHCGFRESARRRRNVCH